jgi:hypothetical protein
MTNEWLPFLPEEWREIPMSIELCQGVVVPIPRPVERKTRRLRGGRFAAANQRAHTPHQHRNGAAWSRYPAHLPANAIQAARPRGAWSSSPPRAGANPVNWARNSWCSFRENNPRPSLCLRRGGVNQQKGVVARRVQLVPALAI